MSPEHSLASARANGSHAGTPPHKRRREKTGRLRRKRKLWKYFSRWGSEDSEDEHDLELYRWCKSKGLTTRSLPSTTETTNASTSTSKRTRTNTNSVYSKPSSYRSTSNITVKQEDVCSEDLSKTLDLMNEKTFLTKLCTSIPDKKLFVEHSKELQKIEKPPEKKITSTSQNSTINSVQHKNISYDDKLAKESSDRPVIHIPTASNEDIHITKESNRHKNTTNTNDETTTLEQRSPTIKKQPYVKSSSPLILTRRKWSANIEADLLRLYENATDTPASSSLVSSWAKPGVQTINSPPSSQSLTSDIAMSIDQKLERTENTPNYVQALAKMFKCRLQMKKEREQAETDRTMTRSYKPNTTSQNAVRENRNTAESPTYLRYKHIDYNLPQNEFRSGNTSTELIRSESVEMSGSRTSKQIQKIPLDSANEFTSFYTKRTKQKLEKIVLDKNIENIRTHFISRTSFPESTESNESPYYIWNTQTMRRRQIDGESDEKDSGRSEVAFIAINARLEKEARSTQNLGSISPKLQKPTPMLLQRGDNNKIDTNHVQTLSRKAKQCLQSNVRNQMRRDNTDRKLLHRSSVVPDTRTSNNLDFNDDYVRKTVQARWPTSIGSMYIRPPTKVYVKPSAQNA